jgi:hypothetical protein
LNEWTSLVGLFKNARESLSGAARMTEWIDVLQTVCGYCGLDFECTVVEILQLGERFFVPGKLVDGNRPPPVDESLLSD